MQLLTSIALMLVRNRQNYHAHRKLCVKKDNIPEYDRLPLCTNQGLETC